MHLAVKASETNRTCRAVRHLLIKGANKDIIDNDGNRPIDLAEHLRTPAIRQEIYHLLQNDEKIMRDCLMLRPPVHKTQRTRNMLYACFLLMVVSYYLTNSYVFLYFDNPTMKHILFGSCIGTLFFFIISCIRDPGYVKKDPDQSFLKLVELFDPSCLCPECEVIKNPRSRHCNVCERCVDRFDHHCPWIDNCVGKRNHGYFYGYLIFQIVYLIQFLIFTVMCKHLFFHYTRRYILVRSINHFQAAS